MTKKQKKFVLECITGHCCCSGFNVHPRDRTKFCIVGAFMTPENRDKVVSAHLEGASFDALPDDVQEQVMRDTGLDEEQIDDLQCANDNVEGDWARDKVKQRQKNVMRTFEGFGIKVANK